MSQFKKITPEGMSEITSVIGEANNKKIIVELAEKYNDLAENAMKYEEDAEEQIKVANETIIELKDKVETLSTQLENDGPKNSVEATETVDNLLIPTLQGELEKVSNELEVTIKNKNDLIEKEKKLVRSKKQIEDSLNIFFPHNKEEKHDKPIPEKPADNE